MDCIVAIYIRQYTRQHNILQFLNIDPYDILTIEVKTSKMAHI